QQVVHAGHDEERCEPHPSHPLQRGPDVHNHLPLRVPASNPRYSAPVRILGGPPFSTTATVCSKCAEGDPSSVTTVHLSSTVRISGPPTFTIGSIAIVIPGTSLGPRLGLPSFGTWRPSWKPAP